MPSRATSFSAFFALMLCASAAGALWWLATQSSRIVYLPTRPGGKWIAPNHPLDIYSNDAVPIDYRFQREFEIHSLPSEAVLDLCSPGIAVIRLNDRPVGEVGVRDQRRWKVPTRYDVTQFLKIGGNLLTIDMRVDDMVPAVWARLDGGDLALSTDRAWSVDVAGTGATQVVLAGDILEPPRHLTLQCDLPNLRSAMRRMGSVWLLLVGVSAVVCLLSIKLLARRPLPVLVLFGVAVWTTLFSLNAVSSHRTFGYDFTGHVDYVDFILSGRGLPLADDGWEMFQPPLYYLTAAGVLKLCGATTESTLGELLLRGLGFVSGLATWLLVLACLRELFPDRPQRIVFGVLIAIMAPALICTAHYVTNEGFAAAWSCGAVLCGLRMLRSNDGSVRLAITLGVCLGAALLSKVTAVLPAVAILTALMVRLGAKGESRIRVWMTSFVLPAVVCLAVSGWHYARVWSHFGTPFVSNHHPAVGPDWWQDPGFRGRTYYTRFGRCLFEPTYCGNWSMADGYYGTFWGDSQVSGMSPSTRPPWSYDLMLLGYWLALLPTIGVLIGAAQAVMHWCRVRDARWFLVAGMAFLMVVAMGYMNLDWPEWCQTRASYGLPAIVALCAFGGWGLDRLAGRRGFRRWTVSLVVSAWVATSLASLAIIPRTAPALTFQSRGLLNRGRLDEGILLAEQALRADSSYEPAFQNLMDAYFEAGLHDEAGHLAERAARDHSDSHSVHLFAAVAATKVGHTAGAIRHAQRAASMAPTCAPCHLVLGIALAKADRYAESLEHYEAALRLKPHDSEVHNNWGIALVGLGRHAEAIAHYQAALRLKPGYPDARSEAHNNCGNALQALGRHTEALAHYEAALRLKPDYPEAHVKWGIALRALGRYNEAIAQYEAALQLKPDYAEAHKYWGDSLKAVGRHQEALAHYAEALRLKPDYPGAHNNWGNALLALGRYTEAIAQYQAALRINPGFAQPHNNWGDALRALGRHTEAIAHYEVALRINPGFAEPHNNWGNALHALGQNTEAIAHYQEALRLKPDYPEAHNGLGILLEAKGRFKEALSHFNEAVQHGPQQVGAVNNLVWLLATCPVAELRDGERALKLAGTLARQQGSARFAYLDTVAAAYAEAGQFAQAVEWQEKTVELAPVPQQEELKKRLELYRQEKPFRQTLPVPVDDKQ